MTERKRLKALRRHKSIVRKRNIRTNNMKVTPIRYIIGMGRSYRLYNI